MPFHAESIVSRTRHAVASEATTTEQIRLLAQDRQTTTGRPY